MVSQSEFEQNPTNHNGQGIFGEEEELIEQLGFVEEEKIIEQLEFVEEEKITEQQELVDQEVLVEAKKKPVEHDEEEASPNVEENEWLSTATSYISFS